MYSDPRWENAAASSGVRLEATNLISREALMQAAATVVRGSGRSYLCDRRSVLPSTTAGID